MSTATVESFKIGTPGVTYVKYIVTVNINARPQNGFRSYSTTEKV